MSQISPELQTYLHELQIHAENIVSELDELSKLSVSAPSMLDWVYLDPISCPAISARYF